jgi:hypothetical protein
MSQRLDRPLSIKEQIRLKLHLAICEWCFHYNHQLDLLRAGIRAHSELEEEGEGDPSVSLSPEVRERLKRIVSKNGNGDAAQ